MVLILRYNCLFLVIAYVRVSKNILLSAGYFLGNYYYFTLSQIAVKAFGSLTASSARTLRSSSMPLVFMPLISLL